METREIRLNYKREFLEEIYFRNGSGKGWLNPKFNKERIAIVVVFLLLIAGILYKDYVDQENMLFVIPSIFIVPVIIDFLIKIYPSLKWQREVRAYLRTLDGASHFDLILSDNSMTFIHDAKETIEKWTELKSAEIEPGFISLLMGTTYLFPAKCMSAEDFHFLKELVASKLR